MPTGAAPGGGEAAKQADAAAMKNLRDEKPMGVWVEVKWLPPPKEGQAADALGPVPPASPHPNASAEGPGAAQKAYLEIMVLELHDSEFEGHVPRATNAGRILPDCAMDVAMVAISRGLSIWEPDKDDLEDIFQMPEEFDETDLAVQALSPAWRRWQRGACYGSRGSPSTVRSSSPRPAEAGKTFSSAPT